MPRDTTKKEPDEIRFAITFDHIGRYKPSPLLFNMREADVTSEIIAQRIFNYAETFLKSRGFDVTVDLEKGIATIEYGRFGECNITWVKPVSLYAINPDFRKDPETDTYCIVCQRDLPNTNSALRIRWEQYEDFCYMLIFDDPNGNGWIGSGGCAKKYRAAQVSTNPALARHKRVSKSRSLTQEID